MCRRVTCPTCKKPDWRGCGAHIEQVLGDVPKTERCARDHKAVAASGAGDSSGGGWFRRLFGG